MLDIEILGQVRVRAHGTPLEDLPNPRLLVYLLVERGRPLPREQVAYTLWPDSGDAQALTNLRREIHLLRRTLPDSDRILVVTRRTIEWTADGGYRLDLARFEAATEGAAGVGAAGAGAAGSGAAAAGAAGSGGTATGAAATGGIRGDDVPAGAGTAPDPAALREAIDLYRGDLAPAIYDDWIAAPRERLRNRYRAALERLVAVLEGRREYRLAMEQAARLVELDALDETAYRTQIRLAALVGDRATGLRAYHACVTALRRELDVEPSPETRAAYELLLAGGRQDRSAAEQAATRIEPAAPPTHPLVGRDRELATLLEICDECRDRPPRLAAVRGEPGIGKTRLIEELVRRWNAGGGRAASTRSYAAEGSLAYAPIAAWLRAEPVRASLASLEPIWLTEIARLVPEILAGRADVAAPSPMTEGWQRQRLFEALVRAVRGVPGSLLLVLDDAHWADRDSLEWIHYLLRADPPAPALVVLGVRIEEERSNAALTALLGDLRARDQVRDVVLGPLTEAATAQLAASVSRRPLDDGVRTRLYRDTGGHPLFLIEVIRSGLAETAPAAGSGAGPTAPPDPERAGARAMPPRMQAVITSRLERLPPEARSVVELAATVGRDFTLDVIAEASDLDEAAVAQALDELWQRQIIREQGVGSYDFSHDRIRDVAEATIAPGRRRLLHRRVARAIERVHASDLDPVAAQLAAHYESAAMANQAIEFHERAAALESRLSAYGEAVRHLDRALALLAGQPPSADRDRRELALQMARSAPLNATLGYPAPELQSTLDRALDLARLLGDRDRAILALNGLYHVHFVRGSIRRSVELSEQALEMIGDDPRFLAAGLVGVAGTAMSFGELDRSVATFDAAISSFDPLVSRPSIFGIDPAVFGMAWSSHALWLRGRPTAARARGAVAVARAEDLGHPFLQALAHAYSAIVYQFDGEVPAMLEHARAAVALCERYGFPYYGEWGVILEAWAEREERTDSVERIEAAIDRLSSIGAESRRPYYVGLLADAHLASGRPEAAHAVLDAAIVTASANEDRWWLPETYRAIGELAGGAEGEAFLERALDAACEMHSFSLAARAAASLAVRRPDRTGEIVGRVLGIRDGLEDAAAVAVLDRLSTVPAG